MTKLFTTPQVAHLLGISRIAVFKQIKSGKIKAEKVGRNYLVEKSEVLTLIRSKLKKQNRSYRSNRKNAQSARPAGELERMRLPRKLLRNIDSIQ